MVIEQAPMEDELGDVLEKALRLAGLGAEALAARFGVSVDRIRDALDHRYEDLAPAELDRLAAALGRVTSSSADSCLGLLILALSRDHSDVS